MGKMIKKLACSILEKEIYLNENIKNYRCELKLNKNQFGYKNS